jgi:hypothetical protein
MTKRRTTGEGSSKRFRADVPVPSFQNFSATLAERDERGLVLEFHVFLVGRLAAVLARSGFAFTQPVIDDFHQPSRLRL